MNPLLPPVPDAEAKARFELYAARLKAIVGTEPVCGLMFNSATLSRHGQALDRLEKDIIKAEKYKHEPVGDLKESVAPNVVLVVYWSGLLKYVDLETPAVIG